MLVARGLGQYDGEPDYSSGIDFTAYQDPGTVDYLPQNPQFDDSSFWNDPWFAADPGNGTGQGYDTSAFWNGDWYAPSGDPTGGSGNNPVPGYGPSGGGGGGGGDVGGILGALKNLFSKNKTPGTTVTPAPHALNIAGVPVNMALIGVAAVGAGVLLLVYRRNRRGRR